jgi:hypothetical protein
MDLIAPDKTTRCNRFRFLLPALLFLAAASTPLTRIRQAN